MASAKKEEGQLTKLEATPLADGKPALNKETGTMSINQDYSTHKGDCASDATSHSPIGLDGNSDETTELNDPSHESRLVIYEQDGMSTDTDGQPEDDLQLVAYKEPLADEPVVSTFLSGIACPLWIFLAIVIFVGTGISLGWPVEEAFIRPHNDYFNTKTEFTSKDEFNNICENDGTCEVIMDALSPALSLPMLEDFLTGTCQTEARMWLRSNRDILLFEPERIRQRYALAVFYCETNGQHWLQNHQWLSDMHECDWYSRAGRDGSCNRHEELTVLRLTDNQLHGTLPPELAMLSSLFELSLSNNFLYGTIPEDYKSMKELDTLQLSFNLLEGSIPDFVWRYEDMVYLDFSYNSLSGTIPAGLGETMGNLEVLYAQNNRIFGTIPESIGNMEFLTVLRLDSNALTGKIPESILDNEIFETLDLEDNFFSEPAV